MPFEHACFISYRHHEQSQLAERFILDLSEALRNELTLMIEEDIFVDRERMKGGMFFNPALAHALCKSVCMIVVYTPTYFSRVHTYCAREYRAMEMLEKARLIRLKDQRGREAGLIIPIILRGLESLPDAIRAQRHYYTFERFCLSSRELARNRQFEDRVSQPSVATTTFSTKLPA
jgi:TIR domain-containing protein